MKSRLVLLVLLSYGVAFGRQETVIKGTLTGADGKPMKKAHVHLLTYGQQQSVATVEVEQSGTFRLATKLNGLFLLQGTGVDHSDYQVALLLEQPVQLEVSMQLGTYPYLEEIANVKIMGDFNKFDFNTAKSMEKQADGSFAVEFETQAGKFKYQLLGLTPTMRSINGTHSEDFVYDGGGDYQSIVTPKDGKVRILFDPKRLSRVTKPPHVRFLSDLLFERLFTVFSDIRNRIEAFGVANRAHRASGKDMNEFKYDWSRDLADIAEQIAAEKAPQVRRLLMMGYLRMGQFGALGLDKKIAEQVLAEVPLNSPLWSLSPMLLRFSVDQAGQGNSFDEYLLRFLDQHADKNLKATLLFNEAMSAKFRNDSPKLKRYYDLLVGGYGDTQMAQMAKARLSPDLKIAVGKPVPNFSFASMEDPKKVYTKDSMKGRFYLLDFWAVWCGPCIAEMENLHKAYEKFKTKQFDILSLSFDPKPEDVVKFRKDKWRMPWLHSFVQQGFESPAAKEFEVIGIPRPILVDKDGMIIAMETQLRGENLERTLTRILDSPKN